MSDAAPLPIIGTAITAWTDGVRAISVMTTLFLIVAAILVPLNLLQLPLLEMALAGVTGLAFQLWNLVYTVVQAFVIAPLVVAVHRFVLLNEIASGYRLTTSEPRFMRFFGFSVAMAVITAVPQIVLNPGAEPGSALAIAFGLIGFVLMILALIVILRNLILFPSIAVDAPGADWRNAMGDTKGHSWRVFFIVICTMLPLFVLAGLQYWALRGGISLGGRIVVAVIQSLVGVLFLAIIAAMASHIYAAYADRLGRPAGLLPR